MICPQISLIAYEDRTSRFVFVRVPNEKGRFLRTDASVVLAPCPVCKACVGEPCHNQQKEKKYHVSTHADRRVAADKRTHHAISSKPRYRIVNGGFELISEGI